MAGGWTREHPGGEKDAEVSAFCEPYRLEGVKTLAFEIAERCTPLPDALVVPTGSGLALAALAKGFSELSEAGLLDGEAPRLIAAQVEGCAPIARAFAAGADRVEPWGETHRTLAEPTPPNSDGRRVAVPVVKSTRSTGPAVDSAMTEFGPTGWRSPVTRTSTSEMRATSSPVDRSNLTAGPLATTTSSPRNATAVDPSERPPVAIKSTPTWPLPPTSNTRAG